MVYFVGLFAVLLLVIFFFLNENTFESEMDITEIKKKAISVEDFGAVGDGITDDTVHFQRALDEAARKNITLIVPAKTYLVSPLKYRDRSSFDWWCLIVPNNSIIYFEDGAKLKLADNAPETTRILVISEVSNVRIFGHVEIDGNAFSVTNGDEHMHGIFIYDSKDVFIESAYVHNCYGDNLFIGGTEKNYSNNILINQFRGETAGRKNLVIHYVDNLHIRTAILDNSQGNVLNHWSGGNSLDLEPDNYQGKKKFYQRIDYLSTYGMGNDFTVGTKKELAKKWVLDIGEFHILLMEGAEEGILSYGVTVKIDKLRIQSLQGNEDIGMNLMYSAFWKINELTMIDGGDYAVVASSIYPHKPKLKLGKVYITRPKGKGIKLWGADAQIQSLEVDRLRGVVLEVYATNGQKVTIESLLARNSGDSEMIYISDNGYEPFVKINYLEVIENRRNQDKSILYLETQKAVDGLKVKQLKNKNHIKEITFGPTVKNKEIQFNGRGN